MRIIPTAVFFIAIIILPFGATAQNMWSNSQAWIDLNFSTRVSNKVKVGGTVGLKSRSDFSDFHIWHLRSRLYYNLNENIDVHAGVGVFENRYSQKPSSTETRIEQQFAFKAATPRKIKLDHRLRLEQRFYRFHKTLDMVRENEWKGRIRYRIRAKTKNFDLFHVFSDFHFSLGAETYIPITRPGSFYLAEQQFYMGFGQPFCKNQKYEFNFLWQGKIQRQQPVNAPLTDYFGFRLRYFWDRK